MQVSKRPSRFLLRSINISAKELQIEIEKKRNRKTINIGNIQNCFKVFRYPKTEIYKMIKMNITQTEFYINEIAFRFPIPIEDLKNIFGECRQSTKKYNTIFTWDALGILH